MMQDLSAADMVATFAQRQLSQTLTAGTNLGLAPITTAAAILQVTAASLAGIAHAETVRILRAYADVIEAGPGQGEAQARARAAFEAAAQDFAVAAQATRDFPQPQGRA